MGLDLKSLTEAEPNKDNDYRPQVIYWTIGKGSLSPLKLLGCKNVSWKFQGLLWDRFCL